MNIISVAELREMLHGEAADDALILDVRTRGEYKGEHIMGTTNIPLDEIQHHTDELRRYRHVYIHCASGNRSTQACHKLDSLGLENMVNVQGGIQSWKDAGFPVFRDSKAPLPMMQQVQVAAGSLVLTGVSLSVLIDPLLLGISAFVGGGLTYAGLSGNCMMAKLLGRMPWNQ